MKLQPAAGVITQREDFIRTERNWHEIWQEAAFNGKALLQ